MQSNHTYLLILKSSSTLVLYMILDQDYVTHLNYAITLYANDERERSAAQVPEFPITMTLILLDLPFSRILFFVILLTPLFS